MCALFGMHALKEAHIRASVGMQYIVNTITYFWCMHGGLALAHLAYSNTAFT